MKIFSHRKITKHYACKAAMYRRQTRNMGSLYHTFTAEDLLEIFEFETYGKGTKLFSALKTRNGYAYGKWLRDLDVSQMNADIHSGDFCKAEFLNTAIQRLHNSSMLRHIISPEWFPWRGR